jgi:hypothetical protein
MRMWNIDPAQMCQKHLLGEHVEMHMFVGAIYRNKFITGYINSCLVEVHNIEKRHNELAIEMTKRGFSHKSPIDWDDAKSKIEGKVDIAKSQRDLCFRCLPCDKLRFNKL